MLAVVRGSRSYGGKRNPKSESHTFRFDDVLNWFQHTGKSREVDCVLALFLLPAVVNRENINADVAGHVDKFHHRISIDFPFEWLPGVVNPRSAIRIDSPDQDLGGVRRENPMGIVKAISISKGQQRNLGGAEFLPRLEGPR